MGKPSAVSGGPCVSEGQALGRPARRGPRWLLPFAVVATLALLFVGWEVLERHLFPNMSTGVRHALLTLRAGVVTAVASGIVYLLMRREHGRLSSTAEHLARLLEAFNVRARWPGRFENPNLVYCRDVLHCERTECPMYDAPGRRCWQEVALNHAVRGDGAPSIEIQQCHECEVFRRSCPDSLTKLGESFNNLTFLLEREAGLLDRMRSQLVEKEKMVAIGQMASGIAHEIGNPLSSISSIVQMVKRAGASRPSEDQLDLIHKHIQRISTTVRQLASLARPAPEKWELTNIGLSLEEAIRLVSFDRRARGVNIELQAPEKLPRIHALRAQLQQVFINLLLNAFDAVSEGGEVLIDARVHRNRVAIRFRDTGCGIPAETGRRVFEPFFTTKEPGRGTGLGLSVSYGIVQKHGGTIELSSKVGEGTVFTVELPVRSEPPDS